MTLFAIGINHNTAALAVREHLAFTAEEASEAMRRLRDQGLASEISILSTCNRTELYGVMSGTRESLLEWLAEFKGIPPSEVAPSVYFFREREAARHMMKVASGLDSLVLGEPQILGQMKSAYAEAEAADTLGSRLHAAFQQVFSVAKRVRSETAIGENPVSVAYAAVSLAQQIFSDLRRDTALLVGAGETIELVARHLKENGIQRMFVANRSLENAQRLADEFDAEALLLTSIPDYLARADIVISSTASPLPLIGKGMVEQALKQRKHKPMFMVDIAVPRDIEAQVAELSDVFLYTVDDLTEVIDENRRSREKAARIAEEIIEEGVRKYEAEQRALSAVDTIRGLRTQVSALADAELEKALKALQSGQAPEEVMQRFATALTNKFLHEPSTALKRAGIENNRHIIESTRSLFSLPDDSVN